MFVGFIMFTFLKWNYKIQKFNWLAIQMEEKCFEQKVDYSENKDESSIGAV